MALPPTVSRRVLDAPQREAMDLMLRALFILDCAGETGPAAHLAGAIDDLIDAPCADEMTQAELDELMMRQDAYDAVVTIAGGGALSMTFHG